MKQTIIHENDVQIIELGGCDSLRAYITLFEDNTDLNGRNIVILDADYSNSQNGNRGLVNCTRKLEDFRSRNNLNFDYYIWPNHHDDG